MDWKQEATKMLRGLDASRAALKNIPENLERKKAELTRIRSASEDGSAVRGGGSRREEAILDNLVMQEELKGRRKENQLWVTSVERALSTLTDEEQLILDRLYIRPVRKGIDVLCEELCIEKSTAYYRRDNALRRFTCALYGFDAVR